MRVCVYPDVPSPLQGDGTSTQRFLELCLEKEPRIAEIYLLQAKLLLQEKDYEKCFQSLETAVSHNFQVKMIIPLKGCSTFLKHVPGLISPDSFPLDVLLP